jgi:hypothetical protein
VIVVQPDDVGRGPVLNLHPNEAARDVIQGLNAPSHRDTTPDMPARLMSLQFGVSGASAGKFTVSGSAKKTRAAVIPIFVSKNAVFEAYWGT